MFGHNERVKSTFFQRFCECIRGNAFIGDDCGDPEFHSLPWPSAAMRMCPAAPMTNTCMGDPLDRFPLVPSSQCRIALGVQGLFHIARCRSRILPAQQEETAVTWDY